jgi:hypothetical protein
MHKISRLRRFGTRAAVAATAVALVGGGVAVAAGSASAESPRFRITIDGHGVLTNREGAEAHDCTIGPDGDLQLHYEGVVSNPEDLPGPDGSSGASSFAEQDAFLGQADCHAPDADGRDTNVRFDADVKLEWTFDGVRFTGSLIDLQHPGGAVPLPDLLAGERHLTAGQSFQTSVGTASDPGVASDGALSLEITVEAA